ncbi:glycosyltransferase family 39 protein [Rivularia sp. PCC 7116]|uniref:glycosyltransferase family 39 protein n=1 Tax=Rivularia sp. PCC 7116 TaxID=373994 RepID=UPI0002D533CB|nr:glycosyltransferase family 39 protein [Rivularia sp. PCC 7116]
MTNRKLNLHYLGLTFSISLAIFLRFWNLELKPLWMDEVITAIFSLGKNYSFIPLDVVFPLESLQNIFSYQSGVSCSTIAQNIARESTHPPLFFCGMYKVLGWMTPLTENFVNKLRSPAVWFGVALVAAIYFLNRLAFSRKAGLMGAAFVAVSPFAVYLSQEARHYTLPMLTISLCLLALIQIQQDIFQRQQIRVWLWLTWIIINIISIYIHYFSIFNFLAQIATLLLLICLFFLPRNTESPEKSQLLKGFYSNKIFLRKLFTALILSSTAVLIGLIPWFGVMQNHLNRSETSWLPTPEHIEPLYQTLMSWVVMIIMLPVEGQPLAIAIISGLLMLLFAGWLGWKVFKGIKLLLQEPKTYLATLTLLIFTTLVLLEIFAISYILGKDITVAPRYNFIYYPSFSALIAASLVTNNNFLSQDFSKQHTPSADIFKVTGKNRQLIIVLLVGFIGCIVVVNNLGFQKPYLPQQVAQNIYQEPTVPVMAVMAYRNYQDVALGLSFALALETEVKNFNINKNPENSTLSNFAFFNQTSGFQAVFEKLAELPNQNIAQLNLWIIAPGRLKRDYPKQITAYQSLSCNVDKNQHYRIGIPYQLYRCQK